MMAELLTWTIPSLEPEYMYRLPVVSAGLKLHLIRVLSTL